MIDNTSDIVGFWVLRSWDIVDRKGTCEPYPVDELSGFLHYGSKTMAVSIYDKKSSKVLTTYGGPYEFDGMKVRHKPYDGCSPLGGVKEKVRHIEIRDKEMMMETDWLDHDFDTKYRLRWQRQRE